MNSARRHGRMLPTLVLLPILIGGFWAVGAHAQDSAPGLIITVARAQDLARAALHDAVSPIGNLLNQIGPSSVYATGIQGLGRWSVALGATGSRFEITSPDYTLDDPRGADKIEGGVGAFNADLSLGLFRGFHTRSGLRSLGSVDLLVRLGFTLGDQDNLAQEIELGNLGPIYGAGLRIGILKGPSAPCFSLAAGVNHFERRVFGVRGDEEGVDVELDIQQTAVFVLLEVGQNIGTLTPYLAIGLARQRLESSYAASVIYGDPPFDPVTINDAVDSYQTDGIFYGGCEIGRGLFSLALEGGVSGAEPFGKFFFRLAN